MQALERRYGQIAELAWRAFRHLGVPEAVLADAVQDTLLVVHRRKADFRGDSNFRTWIYGIVLGVARNYRRRERRARAVFASTGAEALEQHVSAEPSPFERLEKKVAMQLLQSLLDELPRDLRDVFVLVELEELSLESAAVVLGVRASTCKSRLRTARREFEIRLARVRARLSHPGRSSAAQREGSPENEEGSS